MANSKILEPFILKWEGGFVNDKDDLGGATNMGCDSCYVPLGIRQQEDG